MAARNTLNDFTEEELKLIPEKHLEMFNTLKEFSSLLGKIETMWGDLTDEINTYDKKQFNMEHDIEPTVTDPKKYDMYKASLLFRDFQQLRVNRRAVKNTRRVIEPLIAFIRKDKNMPINFFTMQKDMKRIIKENLACKFIEREAELTLVQSECK